MAGEVFAISDCLVVSRFAWICIRVRTSLYMYMYVCVWVLVFQVFRCNYLYMERLEIFRLLPKLNINIVLKRNYERKLSSSTGNYIPEI